MSGGSWDYAYQQFQEVGEMLCGSNAPLRRALGKRVLLIAKALHDIEWVDSNDYGKGDDVAAIEYAIGPNVANEVLAVVIEKAESVLEELMKAIDAAKGKP